MKHKKIDGLIFSLIEGKSSLYEILLNGVRITEELIPFEKMDMGLNRLITNELVTCDYDSYTFKTTEKGRASLNQFKNSNSSNDAKYKSYLEGVIMDKEPEGYGFMLNSNVYLSSLEELRKIYTDEELGIFVWKPKPNNPNAHRPKDSKKLIKELIENSNISVEEFDLEVFSNLIRNFMRVEFNAEEDELLFEAGNFNDVEEYNVVFTRQFEIYHKKSDRSYLTQLSINLSYDNMYIFEDIIKRDTFRIGGHGIWSSKYETIDNFFNAVRKREDYQIAKLEGHLKDITITYGKV